MINNRDMQYVIWQNRGFRFYIGARVLYRAAIYGPAALCATQAIELLLKATLVYHDRSFKPETARHRIAPMLRSVRNKVTPSPSLSLPRYFYHDKRYQSLSRYPQHGWGILIPASFLADLDRSVRELIELVPFQHNTELSHHLRSRQGSARLQLTGRNTEAAALRRFLRLGSGTPRGRDS